MSIKSKLETAVDVATLVAASTVTVAGAVTMYNLIKNKRGYVLVSWAVLVTLVGVAASKYSLQNIRSQKDESKDNPDK
jgi:hypothetical protein